MTRLDRIAAVAPLLLLAGLALAGDLEDGQALQAAGKFDEALPKFEAAAKANPDDPAAALGLSQVLAGLGRYDEAFRAVDAARKANPGNASLLAAKGRACFMKLVKAEAAAEPDGNLVESLKSDAVRWAMDALRADPKSVEALLLRGLLHQKDGNDEQTRLFFEQAVAADPKSFDATYELANYWFLKAGADRKNKELWGKAESGFFACTRIDPKSLRATLNLAHCKAWQGLPAKDVSNAYLKALELSPSDTAILSKVYTWTPAAERVATFQKLADALPQNVTRKRYLAFALMGAKDHKKAHEVLEAASKLDPKDGWVPLNEGDVSLDEGKVDDAVDSYLEAMSLFKTAGGIDNDAYMKLAGTVAFTNPKLTADQREKVWTGLWKMFPKRSDAMNNAGLWFRDVGHDYKKSLEWYLRAAEAAPDDCCIQNDTGLIYHYHMNDLAKSEPYYRKAVAIGLAKGYDCNAGNDPDRGFRDALNNMYKILSAQKRWKDLKEFAQNDVPESHPLREMWIREAEEKK